MGKKTQIYTHVYTYTFTNELICMYMDRMGETETQTGIDSGIDTIRYEASN